MNNRPSFQALLDGPFYGRLLVVSSCLLSVLLPGKRSSAGEPPTFQPRVVIERPFPAIRNPRIVSRRVADLDLDDAELVLGVQIGTTARAYPINMLTGPRREIINDRLANQAIAATW